MFVGIALLVDVRVVHPVIPRPNREPSFSRAPAPKIRRKSRTGQAAWKVLVGEEPMVTGSHRGAPTNSQMKKAVKALGPAEPNLHEGTREFVMRAARKGCRPGR